MAASRLFELISAPLIGFVTQAKKFLPFVIPIVQC
jgi:hypothetical protein